MVTRRQRFTGRTVPLVVLLMCLILSPLTFQIDGRTLVLVVVSSWACLVLIHNTTERR